MASHKNPYQRGMYSEAFEFIQKTCKGIITRSGLIAFLKGKGLGDGAAAATANVMLSPRESSKRGDCRGNASAMGHIYYMKPLAKVKGEERKFRLFWRKEELDRRVSPRSLKNAKGGLRVKREVKQEKGKGKTPRKVKKVVEAVAETPAPTPTVAETPAPEAVAVAVAPEATPEA